MPKAHRVIVREIGYHVRKFTEKLQITPRDAVLGPISYTHHSWGIGKGTEKIAQHYVALASRITVQTKKTCYQNLAVTVFVLQGPPSKLGKQMLGIATTPAPIDSAVV